MNDLDDGLADIEIAGLKLSNVPYIKKARAEIKCMRAERQRAQEACEQLGRQLANQAETIENLRSQLDTTKRAFAEQVARRAKECAQLEDLRSQLARAKQALKPFARHYDLNDCHERDPSDALEVPICDLAAAKSALTDDK